MTIINEDKFDTSEYFECYQCEQAFSHYDEPAHIYQFGDEIKYLCGVCDQRMRQQHA